MSRPGDHVPPVLLIHGGLAEAMDAATFWDAPGVTPGLRAAGFTVIAPDRSTTPPSWTAAAADMAAALDRPTSVVAGSNGVSVAVRLALDHPRLVDRLVLAWPATAGDDEIDARTPTEAGHLLDGDTLRGVGDDDLGTLTVPTTVIGSDPPNRLHAATTVDRLVRLVPTAVRHAVGFPESLRPEFPARRAAFLAALVGLLAAPEIRAR